MLAQFNSHTEVLFARHLTRASEVLRLQIYSSTSVEKLKERGRILAKRYPRIFSWLLFPVTHESGVTTHKTALDCLLPCSQDPPLDYILVHLNSVHILTLIFKTRFNLYYHSIYAQLSHVSLPLKFSKFHIAYSTQTWLRVLHAPLISCWADHPDDIIEWYKTQGFSLYNNLHFSVIFCQAGKRISNSSGSGRYW
jgi:hypothetical protein